MLRIATFVSHDLGPTPQDLGRTLLRSTLFDYTHKLFQNCMLMVLLFVVGSGLHHNVLVAGQKLCDSAVHCPNKHKYVVISSGGSV